MAAKWTAAAQEPEIRNERLESVAIDSVQPHPMNARQGDVGAISESIAAHGFVGAIIVQISSRDILAGSHTWRAAKARGMAHIPAIMVDLDDAQALTFMLADNRTSDLATYDEAALIDLLQRAQRLDALPATCFDEDALQSLLQQQEPLNLVATDSEPGSEGDDLDGGDNSGSSSAGSEAGDSETIVTLKIRCTAEEEAAIMGAVKALRERVPALADMTDGYILRYAVEREVSRQ